MSTALPPIPPSPGVGARRKGPKSLPRLPLSAFSPPNSGTSERFPLPPSPSTIQPTKVIDAHVAGDLDAWLADAGKALGDRATGVVVSLAGKSVEEAEKSIESIRASQRNVPVIAILVPFQLDEGIPASPAAYLSSPQSAGPLIVLSVVYTRFSEPAVQALRWALDQGFTVDIDIETNLRAGAGAWEDLEEFLTKAIPEKPKGKIILSNVLPPPDDLTLPIVKLLTHATYNEYQSQTAALSLYANVFIKLLPPAWAVGDGIDHKEWKRRIKMYVGPALEAFGYERIIFGSSPSKLAATAPLSPSAWFELARESFAELGTEQEDIETVFYANALKVYSQ